MLLEIDLKLGQKDAYGKIMKCYEQPRMTNEETDTCANKYRAYMTKVQDELTASLMKKCVRY